MGLLPCAKDTVAILTVRENATYGIVPLMGVPLIEVLLYKTCKKELLEVISESTADAVPPTPYEVMPLPFPEKMPCPPKNFDRYAFRRKRCNIAVFIWQV